MKKEVKNVEEKRSPAWSYAPYGLENGLSGETVNSALPMIAGRSPDAPANRFLSRLPSAHNSVQCNPVMCAR